MKILVVDDDDMVKRLTSRLLTTLGHDTEACGTAAEALEKCQANSGYDLVMTDLNMPGMGGKELATKLWESHPDTPVVYISGEDESTVEMKGQGNETYLQKPFGREDLSRMLRGLNLG